MRRHPHSGFTLIELSIVLVIIGLLVGGVLVGRDLIRASEVRAQISQFEQFDAAVNTFRNKYGCLPGDCAKASQFGLGLVFNTTDTPSDGNGDGIISCLTTPSQCANLGDNIAGENTSFWQHLANAQLIPGLEWPTALNWAQPGAATLGRSSPRPKMSNSGIFPYGGGLGVLPTAAYNANSAAADQIPFPHIYYVGVFPALSGGILRGADVHNLDRKIDDGMPGSGNVRSISIWLAIANGTTKFEQHAANNCVDTAPAPDAYINSETFGCLLEVRASF